MKKYNLLPPELSRVNKNKLFEKFDSRRYFLHLQPVQELIFPFMMKMLKISTENVFFGQKQRFRRFWPTFADFYHFRMNSKRTPWKGKWAFGPVEGAKSISLSQTFQKFYFCCHEKVQVATKCIFWDETCYRNICKFMTNRLGVQLLNQHFQTTKYWE